MKARYAVFFCPDDASELAMYGNQALGRTADGSLIATSGNCYPDRDTAASLSATPAHYGFHATLKAPFQLLSQFSESDFLAAVEDLAGQQKSIVMHALKPRMMSEFVALAFENQPSAITGLACQCVEELERFRAPLTPEDLVKRSPDQLTDSQREYLFRYGYPYVMSEFRFHMTLTGSLKMPEHADYFDWLQASYPGLVTKAPILDRLAVFWQPDRATAFTRLVQFPFPR